jgi:hypothetical protein
MGFLRLFPFSFRPFCVGKCAFSRSLHYNTISPAVKPLSCEKAEKQRKTRKKTGKGKIGGLWGILNKRERRIRSALFPKLWGYFMPFS